MSESTSEIIKVSMAQQMATTELAAMNIAKANIPLSKSEAAEYKSLFQSAMVKAGANQEALQQAKPIKTVFEPTNPLADENGNVLYANIDVADEFIKMTLAKRAYEANIRVYNNLSTMRSKALELGK
ncbi:MAG: hypothetical protein HWE27_17745 [Gammaproteobacteria bacterium]|nr:hypothetical protein [Gammaproteobacteria bacterium]